MDAWGLGAYYIHHLIIPNPLPLIPLLMEESYHGLNLATE